MTNNASLQQSYPLTTRIMCICFMSDINFKAAHKDCLPSPIQQRTFDSHSPNSIYCLQIYGGQKITSGFFLIQIMTFLLNVTNIYLMLDYNRQLMVAIGRISRPTMACPDQMSLVPLYFKITLCLHPKARQNFLKAICYEMHYQSVKDLLIGLVNEEYTNDL